MLTGNIFWSLFQLNKSTCIVCHYGLTHAETDSVRVENSHEYFSVIILYVFKGMFYLLLRFDTWVSNIRGLPPIAINTFTSCRSTIWNLPPTAIYFI